jgi:release factor glutamine methyltransferase
MTLPAATPKAGFAAAIAAAATHSGPPSTIADALRSAGHALAACSESPRLDAELLLGKVLGLSRPALIARGDESLTAESRVAYSQLLVRRRAGTPVAYLTGTREFWSLALAVTPAVLVPRPETETLVELALRLLPPDRQRSILDLGTGSGAIALALARERPACRVTAVDVSPEALTVAVGNSRALRIDGIEWCQGSWFDAVPGRRFDLIVANPPYVASDDPALTKLGAEPALALTCGPTGLEALSAIVARAALHLNPPGWLLLEHGSDQSPQVVSMLEHHGFNGIRSHPDGSGRPRVTLGTLHSPQ